MRTMAVLRKWATQGQDVTEGVACQGTAIESSTFKCRGKAFLFVQPKDGSYIVRLKLRTSLAEAKRRGYEAGANGWVKIMLAAENPPQELSVWIDESRSSVGRAVPAKREKAGSAPRAKSPDKATR